LLADSKKPGLICGTIRDVASGEESNFTEERHLLALLRARIIQDRNNAVEQAPQDCPQHLIPDH